MIYDNDKTAQRIEISLGGRKTDYGLFETTATADYDGFNTISVYEFQPDAQHPKPRRIVLIDPEHEGWQACRYGSGLERCTPVTDARIREAVVDRLWKRFAGTEKE